MNLSARLLLPGIFARRVPVNGMAPEERSITGPGPVRSPRSGLAGRPGTEIWLFALVAMLVSCYPVVFLGDSFTSPYFGQPLLYRVPAELPAGPKPEALAGSDIGAMFWAHLPYSVVESRALSGGELPLWNRYNSGGVTLLGQGQSMFGDPLHFVALLGGGESWAWDLKFLLAKLLFAAGVGFGVRAATGHRPASLILTVSSAFLGFFSYRLSHAAFFSLCYAPWILAAWLHVARAATARAAAGWTAVLLLANWSELNSGTVKEAYMLLGGLNLCGLLAFVLHREEPGRWWPKLVHLAVAGTGFTLLAAPVLVTFFGALRVARTSYDVPRAWQLQPSLLIGFFDDIFYRQYNREEMILDPSANFLVLLGGLYFVVHLRRLLRDPFCRALSLGALIPGCLVFGVVSPRLITALPFLGNIIHIDNTFSCVLLVLAFPLAGFGLRAAWPALAAPGSRWRGDWGLVTLGLAGLLALYFGGTQAAQRSSFPVLPPGAPLPKSPFFQGYVLTLVAAVLLLPLAVRLLLRRDSRRLAWTGTGLAVLCLFLLHWRLGMHARTPFDFYVVNPPPRADLLVRSPAVELVKARQAAEPGRVAGFDNNLFSGFNAAVGLEGINGPDALMNARYRELVEAAGLPTFFDWGVEARRESLPQLGRIYDLLNVRHFLGTAGDARPTPGLVPIAEGDLRVFTNPTAWPRAFFTDRLARYDGAAKSFVRSVHEGDGRPFAAVDAETLAAHPGLDRLPADLSSRQCVAARDYRLLNNSTTFRVAAPGPGLVVLGEAWMDGDFQVTVNGVSRPVIRVNHLFKAVAVDGPGDFEVSFRYWPRHFTACLWAAAAGVVLLLVWGWRAGLARGLRREGATASPLAA